MSSRLLTMRFLNAVIKNLLNNLFLQVFVFLFGQSALTNAAFIKNCQMKSQFKGCRRPKIVKLMTK